MSYVIGVDIGGTCTDCVVVDEAGKITVGKAFSTPSDFSQGILDAMQVAAVGLGLGLDDLLKETTLFLHSTTVAENAIVGGTLSKGGLLTTRGFEDTLRIMRGPYGRWSGLTEEEAKNPVETDKPDPVIPINMVKGIKERTDYKGQVLSRPDESEIETAVRDLVAKGAETLGVCFLWSFRNPENEHLARTVIQKVCPELFCTVSSDIAPVLGEYERTSTVALNVCLGSLVSQYLANLERRLEEKGFRGTLLVMQAYGGLLKVEEASSRPVGMVESGPVSGVVGSKSLGDLLGFKNIIAVDIGGTTFKASVIKEGMIEYQREPMVLRYHYALPKMDIVSIALAGGSIISLDPRTSIPRVGPKSAGAYPGPVCYGFGGEDPTISDVDLILGYLSPRFFLGGRASLDRDKAVRVFKSKIADPLGMGVEEAAAAVFRLANSMGFDLLHKMTVEKGLDPRGYVLFSYGGTAGMHLGAYADQLGVRGVLIPHSASVHGAFGLVSADIVHEDQITRPMRAPVAPEEVNKVFAELEDRVVRQLKSEGFGGEDLLIHRFIDMRYRRQIHVITTPVEAQGALTDSDLESTFARFEKLYEDRYGKDSAFREAGIEMISFRLRGTGMLRKPEVKGQELEGPDPGAAFLETRKAYFDKTRDIRDASCYDFENLVPGNVVEGPAIIWTSVTTIVVNPGQKATCDQYKNIFITW